MPPEAIDEAEPLLRRVVGGDAQAGDEVMRRAGRSRSAPLLVVAAVLTGDEQHLCRARVVAGSTRDRQLAVLAAAHLDGDQERLEALVRDHLIDYPDHLLAAWIASRPSPTWKRDIS